MYIIRFIFTTEFSLSIKKDNYIFNKKHIAVIKETLKIFRAPFATIIIGNSQL